MYVIHSCIYDIYIIRKLQKRAANEALGRSQPCLWAQFIGPGTSSKETTSVLLVGNSSSRISIDKWDWADCQSMPELLLWRLYLQADLVGFHWWMSFIHSFIFTTNWGARKTKVSLKLCLLASLEQNNVLMRVVWSLSVFMNKMIFQKHNKPSQLWRPHYSFLPVLSKAPWAMEITSLLNWGIN